MAGDNKSFWEKNHSSNIADHLALGGPTEFAQEVQGLIHERSTVLDLGCGHGQDSLYFAQQGHEVAAVDLSEAIIQKNKERHKHPNLSFGVMDISRPLSFANETFDVVYASFSLHYFTDGITKNIFAELTRVTKSGGLLCFICKSTKDFYYGKGTEIEKDMYDFNGQVKHFFSEEYVKDLVNGNFEIQKIETGEKNFFSYPAGFIKTIAKRIGK